MLTVTCPCGNEHMGKSGILCGPCRDLKAFRATGECEYDGESKPSTFGYEPFSDVGQQEKWRRMRPGQTYIDGGEG